MTEILQGVKGMLEGPIDLESMLKELETIYKKYGIPKGMGFVPDKLEIIVERKEIDKFDVTYSEFFNYLPSHALNMARENVIALMRQMGFSPEKIIQIENGVKIQISDDFRIARWLIGEIILQNKDFETSIRETFDSVSKGLQVFTKFLDLNWGWNDETESKLKDFITCTKEVMREHPSISTEIEAVIKKYTKA